MTAVDVVPVSEWLSLGAQRPVVRCSGTGTGGRRCLVRLLVCGVESGVVRPVWRALEHVPGCDRARAWGDGPGAAGWWCIEGPDAGRGVGVMPEGVRTVVESLEVSGLPEGVTCAQTTVVRWGLEWGLDGGEVAWRVGSPSGRQVRVLVLSPGGPVEVRLGWEPWVEGLDEVAVADLVRSVP